MSERNNIELLRAAKEDNLNKVIELLEEDVDVDYKNDMGRTALFYAAGNYNMDMAALLIEAGANVNEKDKEDVSVLLSVIYPSLDDEAFDMVTLLIENGADKSINVPDEEGYTPLIAAILEDNIKIIELLIANGADVNHTTVRNETALTSSTYYGQKDITKILLQAGANTNVVNEDGETPLYIIIKRYLTKPNAKNIKDVKDIFKLLLGFGADPLMEVNGKNIFDIVKENNLTQFMPILDYYYFLHPFFGKQNANLLNVGPSEKNKLRQYYDKLTYYCNRREFRLESNYIREMASLFDPPLIDDNNVVCKELLQKISFVINE